MDFGDLRTVVLGLSAVAVLLTYLCVRVGFRHRDARRERREDLARERKFREQWQPTVLDISIISRRLTICGATTLLLSILNRAMPGTGAD
jgi:hypothetical protein